MKKTFKYIINSRVLLTAATISLALFGCEGDDLQDYVTSKSSDVALSVVPSIFKGSVVTRADGETVQAIDELKENELTNLDVFVIDKEADADLIYKQWHLLAPTDKLESTVQTLLENDWKKFKNETNKGLVVDKQYDVYVAANNEKTKATIATLTDLKALYVNDTETVGDKTYPTIQKTYKEGATAGESSAFVADKKFAMDGKLINWKVNPDTDRQVFNVELKRAAAKILVNVSFDQTFLDMQKYLYDEEKYEEDGTIVWVDEKGDPISEGEPKVEKSKDEKVVLTGAPAWRYVNFYDSAPVFADGTLPDDVGSKILRPTMYFSSLGTVSPENSSFVLTTYSYPCSWTKELAINDAPFIMLTVGFAKASDLSKVTYYYYRIPVTDESVVTSLDRNKIYIVNATIDSFGSAGDNVEENVILKYEVMDWTEDAADNSNVLGKPLDFLLVTPKKFNIYSDANGKAEVTISAYAPNGKKVLVKPILDGDYIAEWKDADGNPRYDKTIQEVPQEAQNGKIVVKSTEMANHTVKTITFRVYLEGHENDLYHDVIIKHFPVDNIQNFTGNWSSKIEGSGIVTVRDDSYDPVTDWGVSIEELASLPFDDVQVAADNPYIYRTETLYNGTRTSYDVRDVETIDAQTFRNNVKEDDREAARSENRAVKNGDWYYWGNNASQRGASSSNYDYYTGGWFFRTYYLYQSYTRARYTKYYYYAKQYHRNREVESTGKWVDWYIDKGKTYSQNDAKYNYDGSHFYAKVYDDANERIYPIEVVLNNNQYTYRRASTYYGYVGTYSANGYNTREYRSDLTNNHMYVIQISSTSDKYILGKPILTKGYRNGIGNTQSDDNVVSPAFMIASQLGAVVPYSNGIDAAVHCRSYLEVGTDGVRYKDWRLPTEKEIGVIIEYQNMQPQGEVMAEVLGGAYYWNLKGSASYVSSGTDGSESNAYVRCVRDLTDEDLARINGQ